jgi:hypothetical protein
MIMSTTLLILSCQNTSVTTTIKTNKILHDTIPAWDIFVQALIHVESESNPNAVGKSDDCGILQITPIYVKELNRIQSNTTYTLQDRFDPKKSLEMFEAMQNYYNPKRDIEKAIKLHNPNAPASYQTKIKNRMNEIAAKYEPGIISFNLNGRTHEAEILSVKISPSGNVIIQTTINN